MKTITVKHTAAADPLALHMAILAVLGSDFLSLGVTDGVIEVGINDAVIDSDVTAIIDAHDPVFLSVDKDQIDAGGVDSATVTIQAPKPGPAAVTLVIAGTVSDDQAVAVEFTDGVGQVEISSDDPQIITVMVQNPENRTADSLTIMAV